ncbi:MAG: hypothetical protein ACXABO_05275 [Promethearchaeota archaeon]
MKVLEFLRSKIILFMIQFLILTLFLYFFQYKFNIIFDSGISITEKNIIEFIANYVFFDNFDGLVYVYFTWIVVSLIPILIYSNFKKAYSMNLLSFFFPNFFAFAFLYNSEYSRNYFNDNFLFHFSHTFLLGLILVIISVGISLLLKYIRKTKPETLIEDLKLEVSLIRSKCPKCGTEFNSTPSFCYNCNTKLIMKQEENA